MSEPEHVRSLHQAQEHDPVCGMDVDASKAAASAEYQGANFYFCSDVCATKFRTAPEKYTQSNPGVSPSRAQVKATQQGAYPGSQLPQRCKPGEVSTLAHFRTSQRVDRQKRKEDRHTPRVSLIGGVGGIGLALFQFQAATGAEHHEYDEQKSKTPEGPGGEGSIRRNGRNPDTEPKHHFAKVVRKAHNSVEADIAEAGRISFLELGFLPIGASFDAKAGRHKQDADGRRSQCCSACLR